MNIPEYALKIAKELEETTAGLAPESSEKLCKLILSAKKIFVAGAGRSRLMVRAFAMRLMHLGFTAYVVGETVTPNIEAGDLLIVGSGSGETASLVSMAAKAKSIGSTLALVSIFPESPIGKQADVVLKIPVPTSIAKTSSGFATIQPGGTLFEQTMLVAFDAMFLWLMEKLGKSADGIFIRHANLE